MEYKKTTLVRTLRLQL